MPRIHLSIVTLALVAFLVVEPMGSTTDDTTRAAVASWLAEHATVIVIVLAAWVGLAIIIGAVWAITYGRARRPYRDGRPGSQQGRSEEDEPPEDDHPPEP